MKRLACLLLLGLGAAAPRPPSFVAALFVRTCLAHPGDAEGLRAALGTLPRLPAPTAALGPSGQAFDAGGGVALRSYANTWCEVRAESVDRSALVAAVEAALRDAGVAARLQGDGEYMHVAGSRVRSYAALRGGRRLTVWLGTWAAEGGGTAASLMLLPKE